MKDTMRVTERVSVGLTPPQQPHNAREIRNMDKPIADGLKVRGLFRVRIMENGRAVGDSGFRENQVVNLGFDQYLCQLLADAAGSKQITHMLIGTGTEPGAAATSLAAISR